MKRIVLWKRIGALMLVCMMLAGQVVQAEEVFEDERILSTASAEDSVEIKNLNLYVDYDVIINMYKPRETEVENCQITVSDPDFCDVEVIGTGEYGMLAYLSVKFHVKKTGEAVVKIANSTEPLAEYHVTSSKLPSDAVPFEDIILRSLMVDREDTNKDGYINKVEMEEKENLVLYSVMWELGGRSIHSLKGLEYAKNVRKIDLDGNYELENIDPLYQLKKLTDVFILAGTMPNAEEAYWKFISNDVELDVGQSMELGRGAFGYDGGTGIVLGELVENNGILSLSADQKEIEAISRGQAKVKVTYKEYSKVITVTVGSDEESLLCGDVNSDKKVDIQDLRQVLRYVCGKAELSTQQIEIADVEKNDGKVDIQDLRKILRYVCKKIEAL